MAFNWFFGSGDIPKDKKPIAPSAFFPQPRTQQHLNVQRRPLQEEEEFQPLVRYTSPRNAGYVSPHQQMQQYEPIIIEQRDDYRNESESDSSDSSDSDNSQEEYVPVKYGINRFTPPPRVQTPATPNRTPPTPTQGINTFEDTVIRPIQEEQDTVIRPTQEEQDTAPDAVEEPAVIKQEDSETIQEIGTIEDIRQEFIGSEIQPAQEPQSFVQEEDYEMSAEPVEEVQVPEIVEQEHTETIPQQVQFIPVEDQAIPLPVIEQHVDPLEVHEPEPIVEQQQSVTEEEQLASIPESPLQEEPMEQIDEAPVHVETIDEQIQNTSPEHVQDDPVVQNTPEPVQETPQNIEEPIQAQTIEAHPAKRRRMSEKHTYADLEDLRETEERTTPRKVPPEHTRAPSKTHDSVRTKKRKMPSWMRSDAEWEAAVHEEFVKAHEKYEEFLRRPIMAFIEKVAGFTGHDKSMYIIPRSAQSTEFIESIIGMLSDKSLLKHHTGIKAIKKTRKDAVKYEGVKVEPIGSRPTVYTQMANSIAQSKSTRISLGKARGIKSRLHAPFVGAFTELSEHIDVLDTDLIGAKPKKDGMHTTGLDLIHSIEKMSEALVRASASNAQIDALARDIKYLSDRIDREPANKQVNAAFRNINYLFMVLVAKRLERESIASAQRTYGDNVMALVQKDINQNKDLLSELRIQPAMISCINKAFEDTCFQSGQYHIEISMLMFQNDYGISTRFAEYVASMLNQQEFDMAARGAPGSRARSVVTFKERDSYEKKIALHRAYFAQIRFNIDGLLQFMDKFSARDTFVHNVHSSHQTEMQSVDNEPNRYTVYYDESDTQPETGTVSTISLNDMVNLARSGKGFYI